MGCLNSQTDCINTQTDSLDVLKECPNTQRDGLDTRTATLITWQNVQTPRLKS